MRRLMDQAKLCFLKSCCQRPALDRNDAAAAYLIPQWLASPVLHSLQDISQCQQQQEQQQRQQQQHSVTPVVLHGRFSWQSLSSSSSLLLQQQQQQQQQVQQQEGSASAVPVQCRSRHWAVAAAVGPSPGTFSSSSSSRSWWCRQLVDDGGSRSTLHSCHRHMSAAASSKAGMSSRGPADKPRPQQTPPPPAKQQQQQQQQLLQLQTKRMGTPGASATTLKQLRSLLSKAATPKQLLQLVEQHGSRMDAIRVATAYYKLGKMCQQGIAAAAGGGAAAARSTAAQQLLQVLDKLLPSVQQQLDGRGLSNIIWACSHAQHPSVIQQLVSVFVQQVHALETIPYHLRPTARLDAAVANTQNISNVLWALANSGVALDSQQLQQLVKAYYAYSHRDKPQGIAAVFWAVATMEQQLSSQQCTGLMTALLPKLMQSDKADPQTIANSIWAVGKMGQQVPQQQLELLLGLLVLGADRAQPQAISNSLLGVAYMGQKVPPRMLERLLEALTSKLLLWPPWPESPQHTQAVANTLWALADMQQCPSDGKLDWMLDHLNLNLHTVTPHAVSSSMWACAKFRYLPTELLAALEQRKQERTQELLAAATAQALANMAWACGQLGYKGKLLPNALLQQVSLRLQQQQKQGNRSLNCQDLCNLSWSVAVLDLQQDIPLVLQLAAVAADMWDTIAPEEMQQLYQVHLWVQDSSELPGGAGLLGVLTQQQLEQCRSSWEQNLAASTATSQASEFQQSVFTTLQQLPATTWQQPPVMEQRTADGAFSIDIAAVTAAGVALAIEVDGPWHFVRPGNRVDGPTQFRNRALAARGYTITSIPYWEWRELSSQAEQEKYLVNMIQQYLVSCGVDSDT